MGDGTGFEWDGSPRRMQEEEAGEFGAISGFLPDDAGHVEGVIAGTEWVTGLTRGEAKGGDFLRHFSREID